jgi:hypothetical protein
MRLSKPITRERRIRLGILSCLLYPESWTRAGVGQYLKGYFVVEKSPSSKEINTQLQHYIDLGIIEKENNTYHII